jgi:hypothetical protein
MVSLLTTNKSCECSFSKHNKKQKLNVRKSKIGVFIIAIKNIDSGCFYYFLKTYQLKIATFLGNNFFNSK